MRTIMFLQIIRFPVLASIAKSECRKMFYAQSDMSSALSLSKGSSLVNSAHIDVTSCFNLVN